MSVELKNCPFCGMRANQLYDRIEGEYVACSHCTVRTIGYGDPAEAIAVWNARYQECGNACGYQEPYGFVPEADCPVHDRATHKP